MLVVTLLDAWCYGVSVLTGWPGVSILWQGEEASSLCNSVAGCEIVWAGPSFSLCISVAGCEIIWAGPFLSMCISVAVLGR